MNTFPVSLQQWMNVNPEASPTYKIEYTLASFIFTGEFVEFDVYMAETVDGEHESVGARIRLHDEQELIAPIFACKLLIPIEKLKGI